MHYWYFGFWWWLIFPLGWFLVAGWMSWLSYLRRKQELDLLHRYAEQGKELPPEVAKAVGGGDSANGYGYPYGPWGYGRPWRWWRFSPYWAFNRAIVTGAVAGGLYYWANYVSDDRHMSGGVMIAVVVLAIISISSLVSALFMMANPPK